MPRASIARDWSQPYERNPDLIPVFYDGPSTYWDAYEMCEKLVDVEENFLVVAPHADDEVLGAGGLLAKLAKHGVAVRVV